jgi:hypothetical protein
MYQLTIQIAHKVLHSKPPMDADQGILHLPQKRYRVQRMLILRKYRNSVILIRTPQY